MQVIKGLSRKARGVVVTRLVHDTLAGTGLSSDELLSSLSFRVRTAFHLHHRRKIQELHGLNMPRTVTFDRGSVVLELIADRGTAVSTVRKAQLDRAGTDSGQAYSIAAANLSRRSDGTRWIEVETGIWASAYGDDYGLARLVSAGRDARLPFDSNPKTFAPSHSTCLLTDSDKPKAINRMVEIGHLQSQNQRRFSQVLWTSDDDGRWTEWNPDSASGAYSLARQQQIAELAEHYDEQQRYLEQLLNSRNEPSFVASYVVAEHEEGDGSLCVYTLNIPTYLPKSDEVAVADEEKGLLGRLQWNEFASLIGPETLVELTDEFPERFKLSGPLSSKQEAILRNAARLAR